MSAHPDTAPLSASGTAVAGADEETVLAHCADGVFTLTLNRPAQYNALSAAVLQRLRERLAQAAADPAARVVVLAAAGRAFCAGHDLRELEAQAGTDAARQTFALCAAVAADLRRLPQVVIARVQGTATAAGCQLAASCDLVVASREARFAVSGIRLGLFCASPAVALTRSMGRKAAFEMLVTGDFIDAEEARARGLVNRVVDATGLDAAVADLAASIIARPAESIALGKELFYRQLEMGVDAAYQLAGQTMACNLDAPAARAGIAAFNAGRRS
jgi:enoyl-CoA hydratase/carnithine racemase